MKETHKEKMERKKNRKNDDVKYQSPVKEKPREVEWIKYKNENFEYKK